jgi:photosystem II stability/assembly factor-like uncharacterized protein
MLPVKEGRDNTFPGPIRLQQPTGPGLFFPPPSSSFIEPGDGARAASFPSAINRSISTDNATFEVRDNTTAIFPDGPMSGTVTLTEVESSRTPVGLPAGVFSSVVIQLTPIGVKLKPGGKLTFRNKDNLPVGAPVKLYRLDQTAGSPTIGQFVVHGSATVSADGKQVETAADAINETSYFLVAAPRPTTTVIGRVVDSDGKTPVQNALVTARGRETFSDGNGGFMLRNIVISGDGDQLTLEAGFHRPDGRVDRVERSGIPAAANGVTRVTPDIVLPSGYRPPTVIVSPILSVTRGTPRDIDFVASDPDQGQTVQVTVEGAAFAAVNKVSESAYKLRLTPGAGTASSYALMVKATDNLGLTTTEKIMLTVFDNRPPVLIVPNGLATNEGQPVSLTISASDPDEEQTLAFTSNNLPVGATLTPISTGTARFSWTPGAGQIGAVSVNFRVTDNGLNNLSEAKSIAITVIGQWAPTAGPEGGLVRAFLSVGTNLFAGVGVQGGAYRSSDQGQTWTAANAGIENTDIMALAAIGSDLFAGSIGSNLGVYRSTDNGQTWQPANGTAPNDVLAGRKITALAVIGTTLFAGTEQGGVYQSVNKGQSWTVLMIDGLTNRDISSLFVNGTALFAGTKLKTNAPGVIEGRAYRSLDLGGTWKLVNDGLPMNDFVAAFASNGGFLFAGLRGPGVYRSMNNGDSWTLINDSLYSGVFALFATGSKLFAGTGGGGVYLSADNGANWTEVNTGLKSKMIYSLAVSGANLLTGTDSAGVFRSGNDGANWVSSNKGLIATQIRALGVNGATVLAGTVKGGIFLSSNRGQSWTQPVTDIPVERTCNALVVNGTNIFAGTDGGVFRSTDGGQNWTVSNGTGDVMLVGRDIRSLAVSGSLLFAGSAGVFRSADNGVTWTAKGLANFAVVSFAVNGSTLFAGTKNGGVFRSTNNGDNWEQVLPSDFYIIGKDIFSINAMATNGGSVFAGTSGNGIIRSDDNGDTWRQVINGASFTNLLVLVASGGKLLAGSFGGVFLSTDNGESWSPINVGLTVPFISLRPVTSFAVIGNNIFAGTDFGVFVTQQ